jgi:SAM-dependent methyltransferase
MVAGPDPDLEFWEQPERVERFALREPDQRLRELVRDYPDPTSVVVLDLGCAGGRNTELLARLGFQVHALDAARAMVDRTRQRVAAAVGEALARERVRRGRMDDLSAFPDDLFDLVVALGVHHSARSRGEWERSLDELARVLKPGGLVLFSQFTPATDLTGAGVTAVRGEDGVYEGLPGGRAVLFDAAALDAAVATRGLRPVVATSTATTALDRGRRVSVNALYRLH